MPNINLCWGDVDDVRIADVDGAYIIIAGDSAVQEPPDTPTGLDYNRATGTLTCDWQADATAHRFYANDYSGGEGATGVRDNLQGTATIALSTESTVSDGALAADEWRGYEVRAYDDVYAIEGLPSRPVYAVSDERKI